VGRDFREGHQDKAAPVDQGMGQNDRTAGTRKGGPIHDPAAIVEDIEIKRPTAPAWAGATARSSFDIFKQAEKGTDRQVRA
jgi:hypothetical protein